MYPSVNIIGENETSAGHYSITIAASGRAWKRQCFGEVRGTIAVWFLRCARERTVQTGRRTDNTLITRGAIHYPWEIGMMSVCVIFADTSHSAHSCIHGCRSECTAAGHVSQATLLTYISANHTSPSGIVITTCTIFIQSASKQKLRWPIAFSHATVAGI